jgi:glycosyltransferase involved in cell wall biosynthesis
MNSHTPPLITFCIPHFNNPSLLKRCLDSLESNSVRFEIVIVDDCSTQNSYEQAKGIIDGWTRCPIRLLRNKRNRGVSFTKNRCYWHASSQWCCFLDCDDFFVSGGVDILAGYLMTQDNPIQLFHCSNDPSFHVSEAKTLNLKQYASEGTGSEALTVVNKTVCITQPYFSSLRGYEGLGLIRLADRLNCPIVLGNVTPRYYSNASGIRLSAGRGFRARAGKLAFGHVILISKYGRHLTPRRKLKLSLLIVYYALMHFAHRLQSIYRK